MALFKTICDAAVVPGRRGFLRRLRRDTAGNVFAMTAAAVVPMIGVVGGAIDTSRLYLTRSRLQAACDSAVLAGRKAMATANYDTAAQGRANAMFDFNYQDADFQTTGTDFNAAADANGRLAATAETIVPMTLMKVFGFTNQDVSVACSADIQVPNIDIVMVLDVTGSMGFDLNGERRMDALHRSAKAFYRTIATQLAANGANAGRVRYGFVPFSQAVNGKDLFQVSPNVGPVDKGELPMSHLASTVEVESRIANFETTGGTGEWKNDPATGVETLQQGYDADDSDSIKPYKDEDEAGTKISDNDCENYGNNLSFSIDTSPVRNVHLFPQTSWPGGAGIGSSVLYRPEGSEVAQVDKPTTGNHYWRITFSRDPSENNHWEDGNGSKTKNYRTCIRRVHWEKFVRDTPEFKFKNWTYRPVSYDVSSFKTGGTVSFARPRFWDGAKWIENDNQDFDDYTAPAPGSYTPVQLAATADAGDLFVENFSWNGCLEERNTQAATNFSPIPSGALDLNWLAGGTSDATRWRPIMHRLTYNRNRTSNVTTSQTIGSANQACPTARMQNLQEWTEDGFDDFIESLTPVGGTYLDIGMIWGLRLISPQGLFGSRNLVGDNGGQISRHIIFLTDGEMSPAPSSISAYGLEVVSRRITGNTGVEDKTLHLRRFQALCDAQRGTVSIWAIGFTTDVEGALNTCADPGRAFKADNASALDAAFTSIARDIADLRLVQ